MGISRLFMPLLLLMIIGCKRTGSDYKEIFSDPVLYCKTVKQLNNVVLENTFPPMIASRNYAYANMPAYKLIVLGDTRSRTLAGQLKHLPPLQHLDTQGVNFNSASLLVFVKWVKQLLFLKEVCSSM